MSRKFFKCTMKALILPVLLFGLGSGTLVSAADPQVRTILAPVNVTNASNKFFVENQTTPMDTPFITVNWQDNTSHAGNAVSTGVTYDAGVYTGFTPPAPRQNWQRGEYDDSVNGSPCFQLYGTSGGMMMNSWFTTYQQIIGGGQNTSYSYKFSNYPRPWQTSTSRLWLQSDLKLPWFSSWNNDNDGNAPVGQLSLFTYLRDSATNQGLCIIINAYDNRPSTPQEQIMNDTFTNFASTRFGGTRYVTPNAYSGTWRSTTWSNSAFYRAEITRTNLLNIINDVNATYHSGLSTNPSNYEITSAGILQETFREDGDQVSMGSSFSNFGIYEAY